ncbi:MAG: hypothetical protein RLZZ142_2621 [Verrucomicrobiota bacterium]
MKRRHTRLWILLWAISASSALSAPIRNLVLTEVVGDVSILDLATKKLSKAKKDDTLTPPNVLKTGPNSRAELIAEDKTITRVGSSTIFSVTADSREVNLEKGSVLFHSPSGKGGGTIKSAGATASVLGTTLIVGANQSGGFKVMLLEGKGQIAAPGSAPVNVNAGQLSFALPGKPPSQPLNFELKGQVATSKLVTGFSKPVASIAKIDAAITQQQNRIANGKLNQTDLFIGDRPDLAFKLDNTSVSTINTTVLEQVKRQETQVGSRTQLDPRFVEAVRRALSLGEHFAHADQIFSIDGSGVNRETSYALPATIPGNQSSAGSLLSTVGSSITFGATGADYFLPVPVGTTNVNGAALVAREDLRFERSVEFVGPSLSNSDLLNLDETTPSNSWHSLDQLLLSAGRSLLLSPGITLQGDVPTFELFAAGASFDENLRIAPATTPLNDPVLLLQSVGLRNLYHGGISGDTASPRSGLVRITAPSITLFNTGIEAGALEITAAQDLNVTRDLASSVVPLGFARVEDLTLNAYSIKLTSSNRALTLLNASLVGSAITLQAGTDLSLTNVETSSDFLAGNRAVDAAAARDLQVVGGHLRATANLAPEGDSTFTPAETLQRLYVNLSAGRDLGINVETLNTESLPQPVAVRTTTTTITAQAVQITAQGNVAIGNLVVATNPNATQSSFRATAGRRLDLNNVNLNAVQTVALSAQTPVLANVTFKEGSSVNIASASGRVAPDPGYGRDVRPGMVNFVRNVFYGSTEVKMNTNGAELADNAAFQAAANGAGKNLGNITVRQR